MDVPLRITFRNLDRSEALEAVIRKRFAHLTRFYPAILASRVVIERSDRRQRTGSLFYVDVHVSLPGADIIVEHHASPRAAAGARGATRTRKSLGVNAEFMDISAAIQHAFAAARRRLQDRSRLQRGAVKAHGNVRTARARAALAVVSRR